MNNEIVTIAAFSLLLCVPLLLANTGCEQTTKSQQTRIAEEAAASIQFTDNAEINNIKRRVELTSKPGLLGFVILLNEAGQPIMYEGVVGKITSGGKRLTPPDRVGAFGEHRVVRAGASDEGTYGSSGE
jgi:hypothetical protein